MKRLLCIAIFAVPLCGAAADYESWNRAVQKYQPIENKQLLYLDNKQITAIPNLNLPLLQSLFLANNLITVIPNLNLPLLQSLFLSENRITVIPNLNLPLLRSLDLSNNRIIEISNLNLPLLQSLYLSNNRITVIPNLNLPLLQSLFLSNNQITEIPNLNLPLLQRLYLSNNQIEDITPEQLQQFPHLTDLYLNKNPITQDKVQALREAVAQTHPNLTIHADDVGPQYKFGYGKKGRQPTIESPKQEEEK
jgi:Leucine-rich repeat (LRR) protein